VEWQHSATADGRGSPAAEFAASRQTHVTRWRLKQSGPAIAQATPAYPKSSDRGKNAAASWTTTPRLDKVRIMRTFADAQPRTFKAPIPDPNAIQGTPG
jgi:hypothetical protein